MSAPSSTPKYIDLVLKGIANGTKGSKGMSELHNDVYAVVFMSCIHVYTFMTDTQRLLNLD